MRFSPSLSVVLIVCLALDRTEIGLSRADSSVPFSDSILPASQRQGKYIEGLGHVRELDTLLSQTSKPVDTKISIYTRRKQTEGISVQVNELSSERLSRIAESDFKPTARTFILVAGFQSGDYVPWMVEPKDLWLALEDCNVILVTWGGSTRLLYSSAVAETPLVARQVTVFLYHLARLFNSDIRDPQFAARIHFVGHSLGAHIAGFVGQDLGGRMGRITGLDPAGPSFDQFDESRRLDRSDALLVDVIHTNGGKMRYIKAAVSAPFAGLERFLKKLPLLSRIPAAIGKRYPELDTAWFGIDAQLGHIDYYANNGKVQPGCSGIMHNCDHKRSHQIFTEILRHERHAQKLQRGTNNTLVRKRSRLMAFEANDYDDFRSGASLARKCPNLMRMGEHLTERAADTLSGCSMPIDMVTPVDELREELSARYGLNFDSANRRPGRRYFFTTLDKDPLVGRHYMLKLYLREEPEWPSNKCRLRAQMKLGDSLVVTVELTDLPATISGSATRTLGLLYTQPYVDIGPSGGNRAATIKSLVDRRVKLMPKEVELTVSEATPSSFTGKVKSKIIRLLSFGDRPDCRLSVGMIEVHPIVMSEKNFAGLYGARPNLKATDIKVLTSRNQVENRLKASSSLELGLSSTRRATRFLDTIISD